MKSAARTGRRTSLDRLGSACLLVAFCGFISLFLESSTAVTVLSFVLLFAGTAARAAG